MADSKAKKKILYLITKSNFGGAQRYVHDLATSLPEDEYDAVVALGGTGTIGAEVGALDRMLTEKGVRTVFVKNFARDIFLIKEVFALFELISLFMEEEPDTVHLNSSKAGGLGSVAARVTGVSNIVFTAHGWPFWENRNPIARALIWFFSWLTVFFCHKVIVVSKYDQRVAENMPFMKHKITHIYNGISEMDLESGDTIRSAFPKGAHITGTIGELNKNKNQMALVEEAKETPDMYVAIVGEGEERRRLERAILAYKLKDRVKLFGFVPAREVLKGFDTFTLPSIKEGLPYVLIEAKMAGLPLVANRNIGGIAEIMDTEDMSEFTLERMVENTVALY